MQKPYLPSALALALFCAACGGTNEAATTTNGTTTTTGTAGTGGSTASSSSSGGAGGFDAACTTPFITKGPWALAVDETHAKIRWEACQDGTPADVSFGKDGGEQTQTAASTTKPITLAQTHIAALNNDAQPDYAGTYYTHEAALDGLEPGTCYTYSLAADPERKGRFCTAHASGQPFSFMSIGDTNPGLGHTAGVLEHVLPEGPEFTLHGGDLQYYDSGLETWASWFPVMQPMLSQGALFPAIGNHESEQSDELSEYALRFFGGAGFDGGETYYRFHNGGVHFFSLNTEESIGQGSAQATWLEARLAEVSMEPDYRFSVVFFHRPLVTCGDTGDDAPAREWLEPLFLQYGVALVLAAHMHGYERFELDNGITYMTTAGGGGLMGNVDENDERPYCDKRVASAPAFHGVVFEVGAGTLSAKAIDEGGAVIDSFTKDVP